MFGGEMACRVCGLAQSAPIWGADGQVATFEICDRCGCEFGYEDASREGIERHRATWLASGGAVSDLPLFQFRVLLGLPGTGEVVRFNGAEHGHGGHAEGLAVEFRCASDDAWVGNFTRGREDASGVLVAPWRRDHAIVVARGLLYVVEPSTRRLVETLGGDIADVVPLLDRGELLVAHRDFIQCRGADGRRWSTTSLHSQTLEALVVDGDTLRGRALDYEDCWRPFAVDLGSGDVED